MKKIIFFFLFVFVFSPAYAIDWLSLTANSGRAVQLDKDSITQYKNYYFYNIKYKDSKFNEPLIVTVQSSTKTPFSARLKTYKESEYNMLNGDYQNITNNLTANLEAVTFNSIVYTCYNEVKKIVALKQLSQNEDTKQE